jgi:hypothetical protein
MICSFPTNQDASSWLPHYQHNLPGKMNEENSFYYTENGRKKEEIVN